jgi:phospholipase C
MVSGMKRHPWVVCICCALLLIVIIGSTGCGGGSNLVNADNVVNTSTTLSLIASPSSIAAGQSATLTWSTQGATALSIAPGIGAVALPSGSTTVSPTTTTTYVATATMTGGATVTQSAVVTVSGSPAPGNPIKHIIFFVQENRSYDNYFGKLGAYRVSKGLPAEADGFDPNVTLKTTGGRLVKPYHQRTVCTENMSPSWNESHYDVHISNEDFMHLSGATFLMDRFLETTSSVEQQFDPDGTRPLGYYDQTDLPYYYELATQFATSDRAFSPVLGNTIPNRLYLFSGTSLGVVASYDAGHAPYSQKTIFRALNDAGVSWRYYYQDSSVFLAEFADWSDPRIQGNVYPISDWFNVLAQPTADSFLPQVIFIERGGVIGLDEHPLNNIQTGAASVQNILNALMKSAAWPSSAFILTFDEAGGLYDHVPPVPMPKPDNVAPILNATETTQAEFNLSGMRVPFIVVSPWIKPNYVSHTARDLTSILKFIETRFNVPSLTARDAAQPDFSEFFDFSSPQRLTVPSLPTQPTSGVCDMRLEAAP